MPALSISLWLMTSASAGVSFSVRRWNCDRRMGRDSRAESLHFAMLLLPPLLRKQGVRQRGCKPQVCALANARRLRLRAGCAGEGFALIAKAVGASRLPPPPNLSLL